MKIILCIYGVIACLALASGCGPSGRTRDLVVVQRGWPLGLTPYMQTDVGSHQVQYNIYEGLAEFDPDLRARPLLAEYWENPDQLTWKFRLRPGVRFHDGRPLTASDVAYSILTSRDHPESVNRTDLAVIDSVYLSGGSVVVVTKKPCPLLLNRLSLTVVVPQGSLEGMDKTVIAGVPPGTGPYRFASYPQGGPLVLERWQGYWGRPPDIDRMVYLSLMDQDEALRLTGEGRADIVPIWGSELSQDWKGRLGSRARLVSSPGLMLVYLGLDIRRKPLNDPRVRRALATAIDREDLVQSAFRGLAQPANQLCPKLVVGYNPDLPDIPCNADRARLLLAQAGCPNGFELALTVSEVRSGLGSALKAQLKKAGIGVSLRILPRDEFYEAADTAAAYLLGLASTSGDVSEVFNYYIHTRSGGYGEYNRSGFGNPAIDRLIEEATGCPDEDRRASLMRKAMDLTMADMPLVPICIEDDIYAVSDRIEWTPRLDQLILGKEVRLREVKRGMR